MLRKLQPSKGLFDLVKVMFRDAWNMKLAQVKADANMLEKQKGEIDEQIETLLERIIETENAKVVKGLRDQDRQAGA